MRRYPYDLFEDLTSSITKQETDKDTGEEKFQRSTCPHANVFVLNIPVSTLFETGSQVTCISEQFYNYLAKISKLTELPVANMVVLTPIKDKPTPVRRQVMLDVVVGTFKISTVYLVIPHLSGNLIIGRDWMSRQGMVVDFANRSLTVNGENISPEFVSFGKNPLERLNVAEKDEVTYIQIVRIANANT